MGQISANPRQSWMDLGSTPAASTTLRPSGYAWQAIVMRMTKLKNMFLMSKAKRAPRSSNERSGAYHMRLKTS